MKRTVQYHSKESLRAGSRAKPEEIVDFIEGFRELHGGTRPERSRLISLRGPGDSSQRLQAQGQEPGPGLPDPDQAAHGRLAANSPLT